MRREYPEPPVRAIKIWPTRPVCSAAGFGDEAPMKRRTLPGVSRGTGVGWTGVIVQPAAERVLVGRVLLACLQAPDPGVKNPVAVDLARRCDSRVLLNAAHRHALTAALHLQLAGSDGVSTEVAEVLELRWRAQAARELRIRADLRSLLPALAPAAGRWCFVKGPVLAHLAYPRPDAREYADLDLLVDRRSLGLVLEALEAAGASVHDRNWPLVHQSMRGELTVILPFGTDPQLRANQ